MLNYGRLRSDFVCVCLYVIFVLLVLLLFVFEIWIRLWVTSKPDFVFLFFFFKQTSKHTNQISATSTPEIVFCLGAIQSNSNLGHLQARFHVCSFFCVLFHSLFWKFEFECMSPPSPISFFVFEIQIRIWVTSKPDFAFLWKFEFEFWVTSKPEFVFVLCLCLTSLIRIWVTSKPDFVFCFLTLIWIWVTSKPGRASFEK